MLPNCKRQSIWLNIADRLNGAVGSAPEEVRQGFIPPRSCSVLMDGCNESGSAWFATNAALTTTVDECSMEQSMQPEMGARRPPVTLLT